MSWTERERVVAYVKVDYKAGLINNAGSVIRIVFDTSDQAQASRCRILCYRGVQVAGED